MNISHCRGLFVLVALILLATQVQAYPGANSQTEQSSAQAETSNTTRGTVVESMNAAGYTYLHLEQDGQKRWVAIPETQVEIGNEVELAAGLEMRNFQSKSLNRNFDSIIFSQGILKR